MASRKALTDVAYDVIKDKSSAMSFKAIWESVSSLTGANNNDISQFYTDLTLDSRFVNLKANMWDLRKNRTFAETFVDLDQLELEDDEESEEPFYDEDEEFMDNTKEDEE